MTSILGRKISGECLAIPDQSHLLNSGVLGGMAVVLFLATREDKLLALYGQWTHYVADIRPREGSGEDRFITGCDRMTSLVA